MLLSREDVVKLSEESTGGKTESLNGYIKMFTMMAKLVRALIQDYS